MACSDNYGKKKQCNILICPIFSFIAATIYHEQEHIFKNTDVWSNILISCFSSELILELTTALCIQPTVSNLLIYYDLWIQRTSLVVRDEKKVESDL